MGVGIPLWYRSFTQLLVTSPDRPDAPDRIVTYEGHCEERRATVLPAFEPTRPGNRGRDMALQIVKGVHGVLVHKGSMSGMYLSLRK